MQNLSHTIRKFNRFELKYLLTLRQAESLKKDLRAYLEPDLHGDSGGSYLLSSLYYDGPDYRFYWEKVDGIRFRRKLRIRLYDSSAPLTLETPVFVEIKQRTNRVTQKRRVQMPYRDALLLCSERQVPDHAVQDAPVVEEIAAMVWQYNLRPASLVRYKRQAYVGSDYDLGLRVTFDTDLTYRTTDLDLREADNDMPLFPAGWAILEVKVNERVPYWLTEMVAAHDLSLTRVSKYCRSIELAQNLPATSRAVISQLALQV
ncbi:MAG TPA: polyphosphate polymerase domain-containing protein [Anaerolineaceae bacterium]|nr:polyphosphate polymerase domain-containing protein [Anaerolineaceae bacterium]